MSIFLETNHLFLRNPRSGWDAASHERCRLRDPALQHRGLPDPTEWETRARARRSDARDRRRAVASDGGRAARLRSRSGFSSSSSTRPTPGTGHRSSATRRRRSTTRPTTSPRYIAARSATGTPPSRSEVRPFGAVDWKPLGRLPAPAPELPRRDGGQVTMTRSARMVGGGGRLRGHHLRCLRGDARGGLRPPLPLRGVHGRRHAAGSTCPGERRGRSIPARRRTCRGSDPRTESRRCTTA